MHSDLASQLFPGNVVCREASPLPEGLSLHPLEEEFLSTAGPKRRREFAAGRMLAREALRALGHECEALLVGSDRAPLWPAGTVGSISHTDDYCVVVVANSPPHRSLGIDAEPAVPLEPGLWLQICTATELAWLGSQPLPDRGLLCHLLFAVKEAVYKYQAPVSHTMLEFADVEVTDLDLISQSFRAVLEREDVPGFSKGATFSGRVVISNGLIVAGIS